MPNTLAHFGAQGVATRLIVRDADPKWIFLGCVLPDVPWILNRGLPVLTPDVDRIDLRLYAVTQSSLLGSLLLAGGIALLARRPRLVFAILGLNVLFHLLLDACQAKIGNGVLLLAPFSWEMTNFGLFWPENWPTYALTIFGLGYFAWAWWRGRSTRPTRWPPQRIPVAIVALLAYFALPLAFLASAEAANTHWTRTLRYPTAGAPIALDRNAYSAEPEGGVVVAWTGQRFRAVGARLDHDAAVSLSGRMRDESTIEIERLHEHTGPSRDHATYVGLALLALIWVVSFRRA
jgi:hypothetical protein